MLQDVIPALLHEPVRIKNLELILNHNQPVPEGCLKRIVSWHSLQSVDLRSTTLRVLSTTGLRTQLQPKKQSITRRNILLKHQRNNSVKPTMMESEEPRIWEQVNIINIIPYLSSGIKTLKFMSCGINKYHIPILCENIHRRMHGLEKLSLRQNFSLDGGYHYLFALGGIRSLDLSLCDLDETDGYCVAHAIKKCENDNLQQLNLAGNYRLSMSVPDIVRAGATKLLHMDCSFCGVNMKSHQEVFEILAEKPTHSQSISPSFQSGKKCTLQSFRMQGIVLYDVKGLIKCIRNNHSLRSLVVNHPHETRSISLESMQEVVEALRSNYSLQVLKFDIIPSQCLGMLKEFDFWLRLNRCGRRLLLQTNEVIDSWTNIIALAAKSNDHNVVFWLLKHGSVTFPPKKFRENHITRTVT
eukprot:CAMPEP_0197194664 /NCGR_PEP_ID=MMETSP1423-20130617/29658_1 /TAXON_ID=476441 /ORGANISM="Pseudo-nitzschia heimii, Strain UNC1101" /LENGTH=412 /DNA_ID=CAMNT_0042648121 /DNA_START=342 /DNA_END=1580 /DNA_ORIENTATION=-